MRYLPAGDVEATAFKIIEQLGMRHIDTYRLHFIRSTGSKSRRVLARIHGMGKIWHQAIGMPPHYVIEVLSERFDRLPLEDKEKVIIHEMLHIPRRFSGGFVPHKSRITKRSVERLHQEFTRRASASR